MLTGGIHVKAKPSYRADIEGLRALAVILVILYHYQVPGISGGWLYRCRCVLCDLRFRDHTAAGTGFPERHIPQIGRAHV